MRAQRSRFRESSEMVGKTHETEKTIFLDTTTRTCLDGANAIPKPLDRPPRLSRFVLNKRKRTIVRPAEKHDDIIIFYSPSGRRRNVAKNCTGTSSFANIRILLRVYTIVTHNKLPQLFD